MDYGHFQYEGGYKDPVVRHVGFWGTPVYEFTLDAVNPLTFIQADGVAVQPDRHFFTDWGSIPKAVQLIPGFDAHDWLAFLFHDSGYQNAGLYFKAPIATGFEFVAMTRLEVDDWMLNGIYAQGATERRERRAHFAGPIIYRAVRMFAWAPWDRYRRTEEIKGKTKGND